MKPDSIPRGGPAFPGKTYSGLASSGLSARDYFAGNALQGICASGPGKSFTNSAIAFEAYSLADAMLAERNKP